MPTIAVDKEDLWERLGYKYTPEEFDRLLFEFGLELDEDTTEEVEALRKQGLPAERPQLKIEIPANRYDLLCIEGIARALRVFLGKDKPPQYKLSHPKGGKYITAKIAAETRQIRPYFACAVLRNIKFTPRSYASFIDLQDKLHQNICRRRQFVAIGTHDLDTLKPPFSYEAQSPKDIKFVPLSKDKAYTAEELMTVYESEKHLSKYLHIIKDSPVYPIIYDSTRQVASMPPIINSEHSKITLNTRNVWIDVTATDLTKLGVVINIITTMFSEYCEEPYTIEPCKVIYPDGTEHITPDLSYHPMTAHASYVNSCTGLTLKAPDVATLLERMTLTATVDTSDASGDSIAVQVPPTRPDILHECDLMEDAAIAYGFNNLPDSFPPTSTVAQPLELSKLSDIIRTEWALAGFTEVLPLILCSHEENFDWLNRKDPGTLAVRIANPKTLEFQVVRTSLLQGLLKTIRENRSHPLPIKVFESSDVVFKDAKAERQARNVRHAATVWCNKTAGFEVVHGMLDRAMQMLEVPRILSTDAKATHGYYIKEREDPTFFPGRAATIYYRRPQKRSSLDAIKAALSIDGDEEIGVLGILHPTVLEKFEIGYPCSAVEFTLEPFKRGLSPAEHSK
ncbi:phenylalanyl-tRNA synthetase [Irpex rosettiformis]|uniref:Phenylalanyl-tRNA synthetase n=1 Tax=Irpex rosettiformis TaxID=378272 RepID=A0ACB8UE83_9APHY|nr:phenylalanyl-tRNA synthetase [Irpex rosettiformis]